MPDIEFINSPKTEEERLKFTRRVIEQGFYRRHGFVVVPELDKKLPHNIQVIYPREFKNHKLEIDGVVKHWSQVEGRFWEELERNFAGVRRDHGRIEVRMTRYGTIASGAALVDHKQNKLSFYLRDDADMADLAAMIINKILFAERKGLGITWTKREALMDFVMTRPVMKKLFPQFRPVMGELMRVPATARKESENYVQSLGLAVIRPELEIVDKKILVRGKSADKVLTRGEKKILQIMLKRRGELVSYDDLVDKLWGEGEFKTYWAINKMIGRLRHKLIKIGVEAKIEPVRRQGYILH